MTGSKFIAATAIVLSAASTAQAQYYAQPAPLYPYVAQQQYVYPQPQYAPQPYPYVQSPNVRHVPQQYQPRASQPPNVSNTDPSLVDELRKGRRHKKKDVVVIDDRMKGKKEVVVIDKDDKKIAIDKKVVMREKPVVRKRIRVVDDPPVVVRREIDENGRVISEQSQAQIVAPVAVPGHAGGRVIHAEAEVTILGPDRMNIRLYRKSDGRDANAKALPSKPKKLKTSKSEKSQPET
jgi:hypothetical protein